MQVNFFKLLASISILIACHAVFAQGNITNIDQCKSQLQSCERLSLNPNYFCAEAGQLAASNCFIELDGPVVGRCNYNFMAGIPGGNCASSHKCRHDFMMGIDGSPDCSIFRSFPVCEVKRQTAQESCMANIENLLESGTLINSCFTEFQTCLESIDSRASRRPG